MPLHTTPTPLPGGAFQTFAPAAAIRAIRAIATATVSATLFFGVAQAQMPSQPSSAGASPATIAVPDPATTPASTPAVLPPAFKPDDRFLRQGPNRKTKQVISLSGVNSEAELRVVRSAIEEVVVFVRLFGITGSDMGNAIPKGMTPEDVARIKEARITHQAFEEKSTPRGRSAMPIPPASGHLLRSMDEWIVESENALSARADFRQLFYELKPVRDPLPRVMRLRFIRQDGRWLFDGAQEAPR